MPTNNVCAVSTCKNNGRKTTNVIYHRFPKDIALQQLWVKCCKRADTVNPVHAKVCSIHFGPEDYVRDLKNELLGLPLRKRLITSAVPSLHMPGQPQQQQLPQKVAPRPGTSSSNSSFSSPKKKAHERQQRTAARNIRKRALERLKNLSTKKDEKQIYNAASSKMHDYCTNIRTETANAHGDFHSVVAVSDQNFKISSDVHYQCNNLIDKQSKRILLLKSEICRLRQKISDLKKDRNNLVEKHRYQIRSQVSKMLEAQKKGIIDGELNKLLANYFTPGQIRYLQFGKTVKHVKWSSEDISSAKIIRSFMTKKGYMFLRKYKLPLPSLTTVARWKRSADDQHNIIMEDLNDLSESEAEMAVDRLNEINLEDGLTLNTDENLILDIDPSAAVEVITS
ncbi:hypothetical protein CHUAL_006532 [Chamberlinius hualienensis]